MKLKFHLTYILLTVLTILAEDIYSRQSKRSPEQDEISDINDDRDVNLDFPELEDKATQTPQPRKVSKHIDSDKNVENSERNPKILIETEDSTEGTAGDNKEAENVDEVEDKPLDTNDDDSDVFDDIEKSFNFDDIGSDVRGYEEYHGSHMQKDDKDNYKSKFNWRGRKKKKGPPRYPPIDKDKLYEVALLAYTRDFHLGLLI